MTKSVKLSNKGTETQKVAPTTDQPASVVNMEATSSSASQASELAHGPEEPVENVLDMKSLTNYMVSVVQRMFGERALTPPAIHIAGNDQMLQTVFASQCEQRGLKSHNWNDPQVRQVWFEVSSRLSYDHQLAALKIWKEEYLPAYEIHIHGNEAQNLASTQTPAQDDVQGPQDVA